MNEIKWIKVWLLIYIVFPLLGVFNYIVDPYGFNNFFVIDKINIVKEDNTIFPIKYKMPLLKEGDWDNILLGTSRIGMMDTEPVDELLGGKTFNLSQPASSISLQYDSFKYALKYNDIKKVVYGVDFLSFNKNLPTNTDYKQFKTQLQGFKSFPNTDIYFNTTTFFASLDTIRNNISEEPRMHAKYFNNGMRDYLDYKQLLENKKFDIDKNIEKHMRVYFRKNGLYDHYEFSDKSMVLLKKIIEQCKIKNINLYVYIPPMSFKQFSALKEAGLQNEFENFKEKLVNVSNYIDFTGANSITKDKNMFWDSSHLKKKYTNLVMQKILLNNDISVKKDFGVLVTKKNIHKHLQNQAKQYQKIDLNKILGKQRG